MCISMAEKEILVTFHGFCPWRTMAISSCFCPWRTMAISSCFAGFAGSTKLSYPLVQVFQAPPLTQAISRHIIQEVIDTYKSGPAIREIYTDLWCSQSESSWRRRLRQGYGTAPPPSEHSLCWDRPRTEWPGDPLSLEEGGLWEEERGGGGGREGGREEEGEGGGREGESQTGSWSITRYTYYSSEGFQLWFRQKKPNSYGQLLYSWHKIMLQ